MPRIYYVEVDHPFVRTKFCHQYLPVIFDNNKFQNFLCLLSLLASPRENNNTDVNVENTYCLSKCCKTNFSIINIL